MLIRRVQPKRYLGLRIVATLIDYTIYFVLYFLYIITVGDKTGDSSYEVTGWLFFPIPAFWFLYFVVLEGYNQATPGHDICKLVVVKSDGGKIDLIDALKRRILDLIDIFIYGIPGMIVICNTPKYQRIGDLFADTVVVKRSDVVETEVTFKSNTATDDD
jgi:uncharacterized RDD family membrane protein YckC